jgi:hypothetical protein
MAFPLLMDRDMEANAPVDFLQDHQAVLAAPLSCSSYGGLAPLEAVGLAVRALSGFGIDLDLDLVELGDRRMLGLWTGSEGRVTIAMAEDLVGHCCYLVIGGDDPELVTASATALRQLVPLVEVHVHFDPFGRLAEEVERAA